MVGFLGTEPSRHQLGFKGHTLQVDAGGKALHPDLNQ